jgi:DNA polymerase III epsilon subunit-like protein
MNYSLLFLDTETTGNEEKDRLCQLCYAYGDTLVNELFNPPLPISVESQAVHHITPKMVKEKPSFVESSTYTKLDGLLKKDETILVAHNAKFDIGMLEKEGMTIPHYICTLRVARALDIKNTIPRYNLQYLRYYLEMEINATAHDAMGDVLVLKELFARLLTKIKEQEGLDDDQAIEKMIEISSHPSILHLFSFGKYVGKSIEEVAKMDRGYLQWMLDQKKSSTTDEEDWIYTLEHYLK